MMKIIFIHFVLLVTYCEANKYSRKGRCIYPLDLWLRNLSSGLCGTDGVTYRDKHLFKCVQETEYGKQVDLQLSHKGACFTWPLLWKTIAPFLVVSQH